MTRKSKMRRRRMRTANSRMKSWMSNLSWTGNLRMNSVTKNWNLKNLKN